MHTAKTFLLHKTFLMVFLLLVSVFCCFPDSGTLPEALQIDLQRLQETWNILDRYAEKIWPGWNDYRDSPFLFTYPNGIRMLVGHPSPPDEFQLVPGVSPGGKKVYLDRRKEIPLTLTPPLYGGGGIQYFGKEKSVHTVNLGIRLVEPQKNQTHKDPGSTSGEYRFSSEEQILVNIHELFHCFQKTRYKRTVGNLSFNADANYAIYAEIEGLALEKAYLEPDDKKARGYLEDFVVARKLKHRSMTDSEQRQEAEDEFMEGTAVYSTFRTLELMKSGYRPRLKQEQDRHFFAFKDKQRFMKEEFETLRRDRSYTMGSVKCYSFGCFQSLLLSRFSPGWQEDFMKETKLLDQAIAARLDISPEAENRITRRLKTKYPYEEITGRHTAVIKERDDAYRDMNERRGRVYVINFKVDREFFKLTPRGKFFRIGLTNIFPQGIEKITLHDVIFTGAETPTIRDRIYHVKWVDTEAGPKENTFRLKYSKKEGQDIYYDAEFKTKGFTLQAPKIRVKATPYRVKVFILSKIKTAPS